MDNHREVAQKMESNDEDYTNNNKQVFYDKYTGNRINYVDLKHKVNTLSERLSYLEEDKMHKEYINHTDPKSVQEKLLLPIIRDDKLVYIKNSFGNKEHPEPTTKVSDEPSEQEDEEEVTIRNNKIVNRRKHNKLSNVADKLINASHKVLSLIHI
mgnify:CR=1 FL=1